MTTATIKRNKNGQQNLTDLRRAMDERDDVSVSRFGGNWVQRTWSEEMGAWMESTCPWHFDERMAIQSALYGEYESKAETDYHRS